MAVISIFLPKVAMVHMQPSSIETDVAGLLVGQIEQNVGDGRLVFEKVGDVPVYVTQDEQDDEYEQEHAVFDQELPQNIEIEPRQRKPPARQQSQVFVTGLMLFVHNTP